MIQAIIALMKAVPALVNFARWLDGVINERKASQRLDEKDRAVDSAIDGVVRVRDTPKAEQQRSPDSKV